MNNFKELEELEEGSPSKNLRENVIGSQMFISSVFKTVELFLGNFGKTIMEMLNVMSKPASNQSKKYDEKE